MLPAYPGSRQFAAAAGGFVPPAEQYGGSSMKCSTRNDNLGDRQCKMCHGAKTVIIDRNGKIERVQCPGCGGKGYTGVGGVRSK